MTDGSLPEFSLPSGFRGWVVAGLAALVGMISGGIAIMVIPPILGWT